MSYGWKRNDRRIPFDKIEAGDRIRVRYSEGGGSSSSGMSSPTCVGSTRTTVTTAHMKPLDSVWLDEKGYTVAHRDWSELEIVLLARGGKPYVPALQPLKTGRWDQAEVDFLLGNWDEKDRWIAQELHRHPTSVTSKRHNIRKLSGK